MVGSEVDHKYLGVYATLTTGVLSNGLYKLLGLSTLLSRKLLRARKQRKLDPTRITKSHDLYRHIIWMAREGLDILQHEVLPHLPDFATPATGGNGSGRASAQGILNELQVLALKMNASFLHIFVLFDHTYQTQTSMSLAGLPVAQDNGSVNLPTGTTKTLRDYAYIKPTILAFQKADAAAVKLLPSSHPLRLSVKLEFAAFTYDCTKDHETSRQIARKAVDQAFASSDPMDDESFEDAMTMVGALGAMAKRGLHKEAKGKQRLDSGSVTMIELTPPIQQAPYTNGTKPTTNGKAR
ncbi:14-3-3 protein [Ascodesmis nigricans]|uniref:14-3-3 protein n=1 Tax=Ascodesmis nigricans TaxID=341454 RepID=A0A4S2N366_9PEZI|nr:14-3-3 protein [Ascodesmis nigricans]